MKTLIIAIPLFLLASFGYAQETSSKITPETKLNMKFDDAIPVLNLGTFHMSYTPDANKTKFDEHNEENVRKVHKIAKMIAEFKPTVIIVERQPKFNSKLQQQYQQYLQNPKMEFDHPSEIELLAYEVGRLSNAKRIYGIDYKEWYNYRIARDVKKGMDSTTYYRYRKMLNEFQKQYPEDKMSVIEKLIMFNHPQYLDNLINSNADMLTHVSSEGNHEGADEAAKFYHRNMVMYSNLNQIELNKNDRIFILMGAAHTAFFNMWLQRSPKYKLVDVFQYLK